MKFEIDTFYKTIVLKSEVKLSELETELKKILGSDYDQYTVKSDVAYMNGYRFWYQPQPVPVSPLFTTCGGATADILIGTAPSTSSITFNNDVPFTLTSIN